MNLLVHSWSKITVIWKNSQKELMLVLPIILTLSSFLAIIKMNPCKNCLYHCELQFQLYTYCIFTHIPADIESFWSPVWLFRQSKSDSGFLFLSKWTLKNNDSISFIPAIRNSNKMILFISYVLFICRQYANH